MTLQVEADEGKKERMGGAYIDEQRHHLVVVGKIVKNNNNKNRGSVKYDTLEKMYFFKKISIPFLKSIIRELYGKEKKRNWKCDK